MIFYIFKIEYIKMKNSKKHKDKKHKDHTQASLTDKSAVRKSLFQITHRTHKRKVKSKFKNFI